MEPGVRPDDRPARVDDLARAVLDAGVASQERRLAGPSQEAEVHAVRARSDRQPGLGGQCTHLRLGQLAQREAHPGQRGLRERGEHVGLVLRRVGGGAQQPVLAEPRVVAGREVGGAEPVRQVDHRVQAHMPVAADARVGRLPRPVAGQERVDHARAELLAQVERQVRQPHPVRQSAREPDGIRRAARRRGVVLRIGPQLQRDRHDVPPARARAAAPRPPSRRRPTARRASARRRARPRHPPTPPPAPGAARPRPARPRAACPATARRAPLRSRESPRGPHRAAARPRPASPAAEPAAVTAPQPEASNVTASTRSPRTRTETRIRSPHTAPPAAPSWASGGGSPRPSGAARCSAKRSLSTSAESRRAYWRRAIEQLVRPASSKRRSSRRASAFQDAEGVTCLPAAVALT